MSFCFENKLKTKNNKQIATHLSKLRFGKQNVVTSCELKNKSLLFSCFFTTRLQRVLSFTYVRPLAVMQKKGEVYHLRLNSAEFLNACNFLIGSKVHLTTLGHRHNFALPCCVVKFALL